MDLLPVILLALIQGLTEWLPISSSGHLVIAEEILGVSLPVAFTVALHLGTLIAVGVFFASDLTSIARVVLRGNRADPQFRLFLLLVLGSVPAAAIGFCFRSFFESLYASPTAVALGLFCTALLLQISRLGNGKRALGSRDSLLIGVMQAIAIAPGISRSGSTISAGLAQGIDRQDAVRFSFLLSIPAILGAMVLEIDSSFLASLGSAALLGLVISALSGYLAIAVVQRVVLTNRFHLFSYYCALLGILVLIIL